MDTEHSRPRPQPTVPDPFRPSERDALADDWWMTAIRWVVILSCSAAIMYILIVKVF